MHVSLLAQPSLLQLPSFLIPADVLFCRFAFLMQPLQVPNVQVVRMELARSPDGSEPLHFYMPDPLAMPCMCVEAGGEGRYHNQQQQQQQQVLSRELVAACWRQAGRVAAIDK
jgi:hypothetical protein